MLADFGAIWVWRVSAHRTLIDCLTMPKLPKCSRTVQIIAGQAARRICPGCASQTDLPVLGVPVKSSILSGWDSLLSIVQMLKKGWRWVRLPSGAAGAANAGLLAAQILAIGDSTLAQKSVIFAPNKPKQFWIILCLVKWIDFNKTAPLKWRFLFYPNVVISQFFKFW